MGAHSKLALAPAAPFNFGSGGLLLARVFLITKGRYCYEGGARERQLAPFKIDWRRGGRVWRWQIKRICDVGAAAAACLSVRVRAHSTWRDLDFWPIQNSRSRPRDWKFRCQLQAEPIDSAIQGNFHLAPEIRLEIRLAVKPSSSSALDAIELGRSLSGAKVSVTRWRAPPLTCERPSRVTAGGQCQAAASGRPGRVRVAIVEVTHRPHQQINHTPSAGAPNQYRESRSQPFPAPAINHQLGERLGEFKVRQTTLLAASEREARARRQH